MRTGPSNFSLICCDTVLDLEVHRMPGDGLLVCHEAASYMTYCHEEAQGYRTVINNRTMMLCKETDPTVLRSHSAGKLLQYCVTERSHVCANEVYALIEVMKMVLELRVPTSGIITLKRIPGAVLEPGTELARIELDESMNVKKKKQKKNGLIASNPLYTVAFVLIVEQSIEFYEEMCD
ncbi:unnamed protein product [Trichobilharzia regenti]|nr:unnamed protein product [Trichobilharzia regenti]